jgi:phenylacetate-CoA ligase
LILGNENRPPFWRRNAAERQWLFSLYHISDKNLPEYVDEIAAIEPVYITGLPSALYELARWIRDNGRIGDIRPWAIITAGETVHNFQREEIERAFNSRIFDYYSSSEGAPFITQCPAGRMHINPESGIIEFLRPDGTKAEAGEDAEMVVTSFYQRTVPLIRYRIGDTAAFAENQSCPCGRQMPIVEYVGGRESDTLCSSERGRVGSAAISTVFYKLPFRLKESQIEQVGTDSFVFRYVPQDAPLSEQEKSTIIEEIKNRLGSSIDIDVQIVKEIPKGPNTKSRLIVGLKKDTDK